MVEGCDPCTHATGGETPSAEHWKERGERVEKVEGIDVSIAVEARVLPCPFESAPWQSSPLHPRLTLRRVVGNLGRTARKEIFESAVRRTTHTHTIRGPSELPFSRLHTSKVKETLEGRLTQRDQPDVRSAPCSSCGTFGSCWGMPGGRDRSQAMRCKFQHGPARSQGFRDDSL